MSFDADSFISEWEAIVAEARSAGDVHPAESVKCDPQILSDEDVKFEQEWRGLISQLPPDAEYINVEPVGRKWTEEEKHVARASATAYHEKCLSKQECAFKEEYASGRAHEGTYALLLAKQSGVCAICKKPPAEGRFFVDHDHKTGLVRGLLCRRCNTGLGFFSDSVLLLAGAIAYLSDNPASKVKAELKKERQ